MTPEDSDGREKDAPFTSLLDEAIEAWEDVRRGVIAEARVVPGNRFDYRPHPESRSVAELLHHILQSSAMGVGELARGDGDFRRQSFPEHLAEHAGDLPEDPAPPELLDLLSNQFAEGAATLRAAGELHMLQMIRRFDGLLGTRLAWFHHSLSHEMYHRGQLALYVRQMGLTPALTQRIHGGG